MIDYYTIYNKFEQLVNVWERYPQHCIQYEGCEYGVGWAIDCMNTAHKRQTYHYWKDAMMIANYAWSKLNRIEKRIYNDK